MHLHIENELNNTYSDVTWVTCYFLVSVAFYRVVRYVFPKMIIEKRKKRSIAATPIAVLHNLWSLTRCIVKIQNVKVT